MSGVASAAAPEAHGAVPARDAVVAAVIVTRHRPELLRKSLRAVAEQARPVDVVVVVDNGADAVTEAVVRECPVETVYVPSQANLGGAGGFALGLLTALARGADWVWCADDDGRPGGPDVLSVLLEEAQRRDLAEISPAVVDEADPRRLAFPLRRGLRWRRSVADFAPDEFLPSYASLFNGALFRADAFWAIGVPDLRLFIRGDETEIHRRLGRSGLRFGTTMRVSYLHPQGGEEFLPILGGRLSAQYPNDDVKRFFVYRNRGYLMAQPGMRWLFPLELVRFGYFFLSRRDLRGLRRWLSLTRAGRRERFGPPGASR
jgi:rhamnopyranosyl-N-acetylglucosaminyl-diphospho-decaprenol beta-1,3/1,4-galactofuranosyltransferase